MIKITISNLNKKIEIDKKHANLLDILNEAGIEIEAICGGKGKCGKCKVIVENPKSTNEITPEEKMILSEDELKKGIRLSCLVKVYDDISLEIPDSSLQKQLRILCEGISNNIVVDPFVKTEIIKFPKPRLGEIGRASCRERV